uniref:Gonadal protein gdl n=1 Tax=Cacopsylla melanoneura TaxID=428564 RepID=A0A8D9AF70_9HEMI
MATENDQMRQAALLDKLRSMVEELPEKYQDQITVDMLQTLSSLLLGDTVFRIVQHLMDIQHVTEQHLYEKRNALLKTHELKMQELDLKTDLSFSQRVLERTRLMEIHKEEVTSLDQDIVNELDEKLSEQQSVLDLTGVPGYEVTKDPMKIQLQVRILDMILRLSQNHL